MAYFIHMSTVTPLPQEHPSVHLLNAEIKALMGRYDVSQTLLAEWLGLTQPGVSSRLRGKASWKVEELLKVAEGFGLHPAYLLGGSAHGGPGDPNGTPAGTFNADAPLAQLAEQLTLNQRISGTVIPLWNLRDDGSRPPIAA